MIFKDQWTNPQIRKTSKAVFINLGRNACDILRLKSTGTDLFFSSHVLCEGWHHLEQAHARGKGVVCLSCHMGAFELLHHYIAWRGYCICVTGTKIFDERLNRMIVENRLGERIAYVERGENSGREILRHLHEGHLFGVLIDQDTKVEGVFAPFLGHTAYTPSTPVKLAMRMGAAIVPFVIRLGQDRKHHVQIEPEIEMVHSANAENDLVENVTRCNQVISRWIRETPDQWVWMHERWKTKA